nr:MAG TPA: hypothetical protein [Caudoviricetes sp.]
MAIQMRRGAYVNFNPAKLMPGEWAVVVSGDSNAKDGKAAYICFAAGDVKRIATYEDMVDNVHDAVDQNNGAIIKEITDAANKASQQATGAASRANAAANQAIEIANSVALGSAGSSDMAALKQQNAQLFQRLANLSGEFIYSDGTVYCPSSKATASGDTVTFGNTCSVSGGTVTLS